MVSVDRVTLRSVDKRNSACLKGYSGPKSHMFGSEFGQAAITKFPEGFKES